MDRFQPDMRKPKMVSLPDGMIDIFGLPSMQWPSGNYPMTYVNLDALNHAHKLTLGTWQCVPWGNAQESRGFVGLVMESACLGLTWRFKGQPVHNSSNEARAYAVRYLREATPECLGDAVNAFRDGTIGLDKIPRANIEFLNGTVHYYTTQGRHYAWAQYPDKPTRGELIVDFNGESREEANSLMKEFGLPKEVLKKIEP